MSAIAALPRWKSPSVLPGFGLSFGFTIFYLSLIVLIPLSALVLRPLALGWNGFLTEVAAPRVLHALLLSFGAAAVAAAINTVFGFIVAWALVRYDFPFRRLIDALVDLPFALPTAVAGIAFATLYGPRGVMGSLLMRAGIKAAYSPLGVVIALTFIGLPFVVRTLQPVLSDMARDAEEASATLGASRFQTLRRVIIPALAPALITGTALAFARGVGEYGSVIFIAGNLPMVSEIAPLLIVIKLEEYDYAGAAAVGVVMLALSFGIVLLLNLFQSRVQARR
ncbi:MAG TPA: sulfate ABC transporter permease subunit CysT [Rhizomicrobium sp.]|nr:sulfate ABC transporter permease subunit CysT [Rhizomicrobium sp.]